MRTSQVSFRKADSRDSNPQTFGIPTLELPSMSQVVFGQDSPKNIYLVMYDHEKAFLCSFDGTPTI